MHDCARADLLLPALLETSDQAIVVFSLDGVIQTWNAAAERIYGYSAAEMIGESVSRLVPLCELQELEGLLGEARRGEVRCSGTAERLRKDGSRISISLRRGGFRQADGPISGILEISRGVRSSDTLAETQLRVLVEQMPVLLWTTDRQLRITSNWGSGFRRAGVRPSELVGQKLDELLHSDDPNFSTAAQHLGALCGKTTRYECRWKNLVLEVEVEPLRAKNGEIVGCIGVGLDVTERKRSEDEIRFQATHDALTGLANYREFMETLDREVRRADRGHHTFALLLLDLDGLKVINDRNGHLAGNRALKRLSQVLKEHCRSTDLAARYGGDEFALILIDANPGMARQVASRIEACLAAEEGSPKLGVSIGVGIFPDDGRSAQDLLEVADQELYQSKRRHHAQKLSTP